MARDDLVCFCLRSLAAAHYECLSLPPAFAVSLETLQRGLQQQPQREPSGGAWQPLKPASPVRPRRTALLDRTTNAQQTGNRASHGTGAGQRGSQLRLSSLNLHGSSLSRSGFCTRTGSPAKSRDPWGTCPRFCSCTLVAIPPTPHHTVDGRLHMTSHRPRPGSDMT